MTTRPSKRQQQAAATQEQLLCAARVVFAERGYQATTVGAITTRANTAHGTFYLYFRNKHEAFSAVMASVADELYRESEEGAATATAPREATERVIRRFLETFVRERRLWRCLLEGSFTNPDVEALWLSLRDRFVDRIQADLTALVASGAIRALDAPIAANALGGMVEWVATTQYVLETGPAAGRSIDDTVAVLTEIWIGALFGSEPAVTR
jgi:AcrR family transcriptional regulator